MILTVINNKSQGGGKSAIDYVLSDYDHKGVVRDPCAELLFGDPDLTKAIIDGISFKNKYLSLSFNFRDSEKFDRSSFDDILRKFHSVVYPGLDFERINYLAVSHGCHVHVIIPKVDLLTGKSCNGHPPTNENRSIWNLFVKCVNYENNWRQVVEKHEFSNGRLNKFNSTRDGVKKYINSKLHDLVSCGVVRNKSDVVCKMKMWGFCVNRVGINYVSIRVPGSGVSIRLKDGIYRDDYDFVAAKSTDVFDGYLTKVGYEKVKSELGCLVKKRMDFNEKKFVLSTKVRGGYGCGINRNREICNKFEQKLSATKCQFGRLGGIGSNSIKSDNGIDNKIKQLSEESGRTSAALFEAGSTSGKSGICSEANAKQSYSTTEGLGGDVYTIDLEIASIVGQISTTKALTEKIKLQNKLNVLLGKKERLLAKMQMDKQKPLPRI